VAVARAKRLKASIRRTSSSPQQSAQDACLRYVSANDPGISRHRCGTGFVYVGPDGRSVHGSAVLLRIKSLVIPPAWTQVWICPFANGHLQATGRDARGRRQYRYHAKYRDVREATKYSRMIAFGGALPKIREQVTADLRLTGISKRKVLATIVRLLDATSIRVGNDEYARENHSFGLTTLRNRHVHIEGRTLRFKFRGKSGQVLRLRLG